MGNLGLYWHVLQLTLLWFPVLLQCVLASFVFGVNAVGGSSSCHHEGAEKTSSPSHWTYIKTSFDSATAAVCKSHCSSELQLTFFSQIPATVGLLLHCQSMGNYLFFSYTPIPRPNSFEFQLLDQSFHFLDKISNILLQEVQD